MAHVYTLETYGKPSVVLSLVAGGSLDADETYYYRVATSNSKYPGSASIKSPASDVQSITTDAVNRTVRITITHAPGGQQYTQVWCSKGVDPGVGNWLDRDAFPNIVYLSNGSTNQTCITGNPVAEVDDDGVTYGWFSYVYEIQSPNYGFSPIYENGKARLDCSGGTEGDPISFDTIYAEAIAQGWNPAATIERLTIEPSYTGLLNTVGYALNFCWLEIADTFEDKDKIVTVSNCYLLFNGTTTLGRYFATQDLTLEGVNFIVTGHGTSYGQVYFNTDDPVRLYDCECYSKRATYSSALSYSGRFRFNGDDWQIIDFKCKGGPSPGLNNGFEILGASTACLLKRASLGYHRYAGWWSTEQPFEVVGSVLNPYSGTGVRMFQKKTDEVERVYNDVQIPGAPGDDPLYLNRRSVSYTNQSKVAFINSVVTDFTEILWYGEMEFPEVPGSYAELRNTVNVRVDDPGGIPIDGASVTLTNALGVEVFSVPTDAAGEIAEQIATVTQNVPDPNSAERSYKGGIVTEYGPFEIVVSAPGFVDFQTVFEIDRAIALEVGLNPAGDTFAEALAVTVDADALEALVADDRLTVTIDEPEVALEAPGESVTVNENETEVFE